MKYSQHWNAMADLARRERDTYSHKGLHHMAASADRDHRALHAHLSHLQHGDHTEDSAHHTHNEIRKHMAHRLNHAYSNGIYLPFDVEDLNTEDLFHDMFSHDVNTQSQPNPPSSETNVLGIFGGQDTHYPQSGQPGSPDPENHVETVGQQVWSWVQSALKEAPLGDMKRMRTTFLPVAIGTVRDGFVVPHTYFSESGLLAQYKDFLQFVDLQGLSNWIEFMADMKQQGHDLSHMDLFQFQSLCETHQVPSNQWLIPFPEVRLGHTGYNHIECRSITIWEFSVLAYEQPTGDLLWNGILQTFLFGFPILRKIVHALDCVPALYPFLRARLLHGYMDGMLAGKDTMDDTFASFFLPPAVSGSSGPSNVEAFLSHTSHLPSFDATTLENTVRYIQTQLPGTRYLGSNSLYTQAAAQAGLLKQFDSAYVHYLQTPIHVGQKVGPELFSDIFEKGTPLEEGTMQQHPTNDIFDRDPNYAKTFHKVMDHVEQVQFWLGVHHHHQQNEKGKLPIPGHGLPTPGKIKAKVAKRQATLEQMIDGFSSSKGMSQAQLDTLKKERQMLADTKSAELLRKTRFDQSVKEFLHHIHRTHGSYEPDEVIQDNEGREWYRYGNIVYPMAAMEQDPHLKEGLYWLSRHEQSAVAQSFIEMMREYRPEIAEQVGRPLEDNKDLAIDQYGIHFTKHRSWQQFLSVRKVAGGSRGMEEEEDEDEDLNGPYIPRMNMPPTQSIQGGAYSNIGSAITTPASSRRQSVQANTSPPSPKFAYVNNSHEAKVDSSVLVPNVSQVPYNPAVDLNIAALMDVLVVNNGTFPNTTVEPNAVPTTAPPPDPTAPQTPEP